jgi:hypothetical protein
MVRCPSRFWEISNSLQKKGESKDYKIFKPPPFGKRTDHPLGKSLTCFVSHFSCERNKQPTFKFNIEAETLFIYRLIPRMPNFLGWFAIFYTTPISRFWEASRSVHGHIQHKNACFWVSVDRYALHCADYKIWRWIVYLGFEKYATL